MLHVDAFTALSKITFVALDLISIIIISSITRIVLFKQFHLLPSSVSVSQSVTCLDQYLKSRQHHSGARWCDIHVGYLSSHSHPALSPATHVWFFFSGLSSTSTYISGNSPALLSAIFSSFSFSFHSIRPPHWLFSATHIPQRNDTFSPLSRTSPSLLSLVPENVHPHVLIVLYLSQAPPFSHLSLPYLLPLAKRPFLSPQFVLVRWFFLVTRARGSGRTLKL